MTKKEVAIILSEYRRKCSIYDKKLFALCKLRYEMQGLKGFDYSAIRVQGGESENVIERLIDKEIELSKVVQQALIDKTTSYEYAMKIIYLLPNKDNDCDILADIYLLGKSYGETAKNYNYDINSLWNKVGIAKKKLSELTEELGLKFENFYFYEEK